MDSREITGVVTGQDSLARLDDGILIRNAEWELLEAGWQRSRHGPWIVYLEGAFGVGKSTLMQSWLRQRHRGCAWVTRAHGVPPNPDAITRHLSAFLQSEGHPGSPQLAVDILEWGAQGDGLVWVIEDYGAWRGADLWLRREVFGKLNGPVLVILESREPIQRMWSGDRSLMARTSWLRVERWTLEEMERYWTRRGLPDDWGHVAFQIASGRASVLARIADSLAADGDGLGPPAEMALRSFVVERGLHPGSRRMAWRAGFGDHSVDELIGAALVVPWVNRSLMAAMVGMAAMQARWEEFVALPVLDSLAPGVFGFPLPFRRLTYPLIEQARPWALSQWRWRAALWATGEAGSDGETTLALPVLEALACPPPAMAWSGRIEHALETLTAIDDDGRPVGWLYGRFPGGPGEVAVVEGVGTVGWAPGAERALAAAWWAHVALSRRASWTAPTTEFWTERLLAMGFTRGTMEGQWVWEAEQDYGTWLRLQCLGRRRAATVKEATQVVQHALECLHHPTTLQRVAIADHWPGSRPPSPANIRRWLMDAIASAELDSVPLARAVLTLYYVERRGSHESLAERLHISRATYFRTHQRALRALAAQLLAIAEDGRNETRSDTDSARGCGVE